jgi:ABC-type xylose transport system permease subunit
LGSIYAALQVTASKIFIIPSLLFLITGLYMAGIFSDAYMMIADTAVVTPWFNDFPVLAQVMDGDNLGIITGSLGLVILVATYWRTRGSVTEVGL